MPPRKRSSSSQSGRFVVSGPYEQEKLVESVGMGMSQAQSWATKHRKVEGVLTYYIRTLTGEATLGVVTKEEDGSITTRGHSMLDPTWTPQAGYSHAERLMRAGSR